MDASLLSPGFLALAAAAILLLTALAGRMRQLAFSAINLVFIGGFVLSPIGLVSTLAFVGIGYGLVRAVNRYDRRAIAPALAGFTALFVYMQRYEFLTLIFPDAMMSYVLATIGLSFLFFKIMHVIIDAYSGTIGTLSFATYFNYCLNFTTFMMGPIQRYQDYHRQWTGETQSIDPTFEAHLDAALRILIGFFKAYVLARLLLPWALAPDAALLELSGLGLFRRVYAFWFYLYFNFSGYCDIVIGIGSLMGVRPPENFNHPYLARNISDFWLRQHRSLTLWLTDYVFTPLYKNALTRPVWQRHKLLAVNGSLMATMMVSGLWHGTTFSFFLFGLTHGVWFVVNRTWDALLIASLGKPRVTTFRRNWLVRAGGTFLTFNATAFAFIFFRVSPEAILAATRGIIAT